MSEYPGSYYHVAVRLNNYIVVIGGWDRNHQQVSTHVIWMYNVYTDQWSKYHIPGKKSAPPALSGACATAIDTDIYMFGGFSDELGRHTNEIWKLTRTPQGYFDWSKIIFQHDEKLLSPRKGHSGWEYDKCLWVFGGSGPVSPESLNDHGDFSGIFTNQLLCYDPSTQMWTNPECFGAVPTPRSDHSTDIIRDKVWLFAGIDNSWMILEDFFELDMQSHVWTQITTDQTKPQGRFDSSLSANFDRQLVLHGGISEFDSIELSDTWIMDLPSQTWRKYTSYQDHGRSGHTGSLGANKSIVIIGGDSSENPDYTPIFHVMLEAKSLQHLAMKIIYNNEGELPWRCLPSKLVAQLGLLQNNKEDSERSSSKRHTAMKKLARLIKPFWGCPVV